MFPKTWTSPFLCSECGRWNQNERRNTRKKHSGWEQWVSGRTLLKISSLTYLNFKQPFTHVIVVQSLLDSLGTKSHRTAMKDLKKIFGGNRGLNQDNKKLVDSILRNAQREEPVIQQVVQAQGYRQGPQFGLPGPYQNRSFTGVCHFCGLPGHYVRDCPAQTTFQPESFRPPFGGRGRKRFWWWLC